MKREIIAPLQLTSSQIEEIKATHQTFLTDLEAAAVKALARGDWEDVES